MWMRRESDPGAETPFAVISGRPFRTLGIGGRAAAVNSTLLYNNRRK